MENDRTISANSRARRAVRLFPKTLVLGYLLAASLLATVSPLCAQSLSIAGTVSDAQDAPIAGVTVRLTGVASASGDGLPGQQTTTDVTGQYRFDGLGAGAGILHLTREGFQPQSLEVRLTTQSKTLDVQLDVGGVATQIEVTGTMEKSTASRMPLPDIEIPVQVTSVPLPVLQEQGANDLVTALRNVSGVTAFRSYGMYEYYTVRGFNSSNVVLVDGMRLEGNRLNSQLNNVERVEVLKGPASVLYGGQALSGSINIIRKKPQQQPAFDFFYRGGRFNTHQGGGGATGQLGRSSSLLYRIDSSLESSDAWRNAGARRFNVSPAVTWIPQELILLTVMQAFNRDNFDGDAGVPVGVTFRPDYDPAWRFNTPQDFSESRDSQTHVLLTVGLAEQSQFRNSFFYRHAKDEYFTAETLTYQPALNQVSRFGISGQTRAARERR